MPPPAAMDSVSSGTKRKAASVATTLTPYPASLRRRITPGALYAAIPPVTPTTTLATTVVYRAPGARTRTKPRIAGVPECTQTSNMRLVKSADVRRTPWADYALAFVAAFALCTGWFARVYHLGFPPRQIWDEIYFPV